MALHNLLNILKVILVILESSEVSSSHAKSTSKVPLLTYNLRCDNNAHYCYQGFTNKSTYSQAWYKCHSLGMHLAMPRTQKQLDFVRNSILGTSDHEEVWIGLVANETVTHWMWQDYIDLADTGVTSWKSGNPSKSRRRRATSTEKSAKKSAGKTTNTTTTHAFCVLTDKDGWSNDDCAATHQFVCQTYTNGCDENTPYLFGDKCYQLVTGNTSASASLCSSTGGALAMPKTDQINDYIYNINYGGVAMWIGLYRPEGDESIPFEWMDGDSITEEYLATHVTHASVIVRSGHQSDHYVYMIGSGYWNTAYINDRADLSYICEYPRIETNTAEVNDNIEDCESLTISNGNTISQNTTEGTVHDVTCDYGYKSATSIATCQSDGNWYRIPVCLLDEEAFCACEEDENDNNITLDEIVNLIIKNLTVDRSQLSRTRRKLSSADDNRISSQCIGWTGIVITTVFCSVIIISDLIKLISSIFGKPREFNAVIHQYR